MMSIFLNAFHEQASEQFIEEVGTVTLVCTLLTVRERSALWLKAT